MALTVLLNSRIFVAGADVTSDTTKVELNTSYEAKDTTAFNSGWKTELAGLATSKWSASGNWNVGTLGMVDDSINATLGTSQPWTFFPEGNTASANTGAYGDLAFFTNALETDYTTYGKVGDVMPWSANAMGNWPVVRGINLHPAGTARTSTGNGTGQQITAGPTTTQNLYANLHVYSVAGATPSLTVVVQSSVDNTFASPTTRLTFNAATTYGGQALRVPGAITDTWYRVNYTISGSSPSFLFVCSLGVA